MSTQTKINRRIFIVGCPRSGTTLLQSLLAAHSQIYSFPESQFFPYLFSNDQATAFTTSPIEQTWNRPIFKLMARKLVFGIARSQLLERLSDFLQDLDSLDSLSEFPQAAIALKTSYARCFRHTLDQLTQTQDKSIWIEKSPLHLYYVNYIAEHIPKAQFIHILRDGSDTIASLYDVWQRYPENWQLTSTSVDQCISRWLRDVHLSQRYRHRPDHVIVRYEHLVDQPAWMLEQLCKTIGIPYEPTMLSQYNQIAQKVSLPSEPWKQKVQQPIQNQNSTKFNRVFNTEQQQKVLQRTASIDLDKIATLQPPQSR